MDPAGGLRGLAPVACFALVQFVFIPRFVKKLAVPAAAEPAAEAAAAPKAVADSKAPGPANSYDFSNVVVNLSGSMGTRYLKTTFTVRAATRLSSSCSTRTRRA